MQYTPALVHYTSKQNEILNYSTTTPFIVELHPVGKDQSKTYDLKHSLSVCLDETDKPYSNMCSIQSSLNRTFISPNVILTESDLSSSLSASHFELLPSCSNQPSIQYIYLNQKEV